MFKQNNNLFTDLNQDQSDSIRGGARFSLGNSTPVFNEKITFEDEITIVCNGNNCGVHDESTQTSYPLP